MKPMILVVSNNGCLFDSLASQLAARGVAWTRFESATAALKAMAQRTPALVVLDAGNDSRSRTMARLKRIQTRCPTAVIFLITQQRSESLAVGALKAGVADYFRPPFSAEDLLAAIERKLSLPSGSTLRRGSRPEKIASRLVGRSPVMENLKAHLGRVAMADSTVFITGETGTGKELAAQLIHANSTRAQHAMVSVNCAALPDSLVESELFGHERGAFTGAAAMTRGCFEQANGGTVFLDEIGDMTPLAQAKILRVIEEKQLARVGGAASIPLDFRLIAATNREPETLMAEGNFRDDLYYRLNVARVHMPSLRDHREDIEQLAAHGIRRLNKKFSRNVKGLKKDVVKLLLRYDWRGNVRELLNVLEGAYINMPSGRIDYADLPSYFKQKLAEYQHLPSNERRRILTALVETNWNKSTAAAKLKWSRMTLYRNMKKYNIVENRKRGKL